MGAAASVGRGKAAPALVSRAAAGDLAELRSLLEAGCDVNACDADGRTAVYAAALRGHASCCDALLAAGCDPNREKRTDGATPALAAAQNGHLACVSSLAAHKDFAVNKSNVKGATPLFIACENGHLDIVIRLLQTPGVDVDAAMSDGATPLIVATYKDHLEVVRTLLPRKPNMLATMLPSAGPLAGATAHSIAVQERLAGIAILIEDFGGAPADRSREARRVLRAAECGDASQVAALLKACEDLDLDIVDERGRTPVYLAALRGHAHIVAALAARGANVNLSKPNGCSPCYAAAQEGHADVVAQLVADGADVNRAMADGSTPAGAAAQNGRLDALDALSKASGFDVDRADSDGWTPLHAASYHNKLDAARSLVRKGADPTVLTKAKAGGVDPGTSALSIARQKGHEQLVLFLSDDTARPRATTSQKAPHKDTPQP